MDNKDNKEKRWVNGGYKPKSVTTSVSWGKRAVIKEWQSTHGVS
jgi:hypothetical protein